MENEKVLDTDAGSVKPAAGKNARLRARAVVDTKFAFYIHLAAYLGVNLLLAAINFMATPGYLWVLWPVAGWGLGLLFHAIVAFSLSGVMGARRRMYEEELTRQAEK